MPLTITSRIEDNLAILELAGSLTLGPSLKALRENARELLKSANVSGIILRVAQVTNTDSSGLGELTVVYTFASRRGCPIRLVEVTPRLRQMLELTRLDGLLPSAIDLVTAKKELKGR
ncbi:MAG: STAS domain-containing protein [Acidobacteriaceae bacterium]|nr:STAS domain-containing protein [Acidobacteriaceae bacterium]MBV9763397.1 STAS domain-containing protein [Acidobacteriaceae bacterium]